MSEKISYSNIKTKDTFLVQNLSIISQAPALSISLNPKTRGKYRNYSYDDLERAKNAIVNGESLTKTAIAFGIPYNTLYSFKGKITPTRKQMKLFNAITQWHQPPPNIE